MKYLLTREAFERLNDAISRARNRANDAATDGFKSGAEQDGHHDECYQLSLRETALLDQRLKELEEIRSNVEIITPTEQSDTVQIESGVELQYGDGSIFRFIVVGYAFATTNNGDLEEVSIYSPIGKAVLGARSGEKRDLIVGNRHIEVKVVKIYPPSKARDMKV